MWLLRQGGSNFHYRVQKQQLHHNRRGSVDPQFRELFTASFCSIEPSKMVNRNVKLFGCLLAAFSQRVNSKSAGKFTLCLGLKLCLYALTFFIHVFALCTIQFIPQFVQIY